MQNNTFKSIFYSLITSALVVGVFYLFVPPKTIYIEHNRPQLEKKLVTQNEALLKEISKKTEVNHFVSAAESAKATVVFVQVLRANANGGKDENYSAGSGSGVLLSSDGYIISNYHVIKDAHEIRISLEDKRAFGAEIVGFDEDTDLALLKIEAQNLAFIDVTDSDDLRVGEWVLAIGNPFNLESSVTAGIVSAKGRNINLFDKSQIEAFIQTDAAVNPGSSGGALVNTVGQLVGINTAILTNSGNYEGFSFAVPSNIVVKIYKDILEFGAVQRGWLGVTIESITDRDSKDLGLKKVSGVKLKIINKNSAAAQADLRKNDVIIKVNGEPITNVADFMGQVATYRPGDLLDLIVIRKGNQIHKKVTLLNHLNTTDFLAIRKDKVLQEIGIELRPLSSEEMNRTNKKQGAKVISVLHESPASKANLDSNYIITSINDQSFDTIKEALELINENRTNIKFDGFYESYPGKYHYKIKLD